MILSRYYNINKSQEKLEFVDIDIQNDLQLFIDPYIFTKLEGTFAAKCNNLIINFFNQVIDAIRRNDQVTARHMLNGLKEPSATHLGVSDNSFYGKAVTGKKALKLYEKLRKSRAIKTGNLRDLSDCELMVKGIGKDNLSDITTNIIKEQLIEFTQNQCRLYNIPTKEFKILVWSSSQKRWVSKIFNLPFVGKNEIILVPKTIVTDKLLLNYNDFYKQEMIPFYEREEINACSTLVRVLRSGEKRVCKRELKKKYPVSKDFVYEFIDKNPEYLELYKERKKIFRNIDADEIIYKAHEKNKKVNEL